MRLREELRRIPPAGDQKWVAASLSEVAGFFGLSIQTVKQWRMETPPMPGSEGKWSLPEIVKWRHAKLGKSGLSDEKKRVDIELAEVAVEQKRLDLAKDRGEVVEISEVELWAASAIVEVREMIMALPDMLAAAAPKQLRDFVRDETDRHCRDVLSMLRRRLEVNAIEIPAKSDQPVDSTGSGQIA